MKIFIAQIFLAFLLIGCTKSVDNYTAKEAVYDTAEMSEEAYNYNDTEGNPDIDLVEKILIKRGSLAFQTNDVEQKHQEILQLVKQHNGYVANDQNYTSSNRKTYNTQVRLPKANFDKFVNDLSQGVSHFDQKEISVEDVTEEFVDIQARLKTKKELETRYLELLKKAKTVTEMLEIEKQIGELQSDIESIEGRMKYLTQQVQYSTLHLDYYEKTTVGNNFGQKFINGFKNGWNNLIWFFVGLVNIWPFLLIFGVSFFFLVRWIRKRRNRK